jgi:F-type H+-transporting ATPase subunit delta
MAKTKHNPTYALAYAGTLLEMASERQQADTVAADLVSLQDVLSQNPTFCEFLRDPSVSESEKAATLKKVFDGKIVPLLGYFLQLLNAKRRLGEINQIAATYKDLLDQQSGKIEVDVTVAAKLSTDELEQVRQKVSAALKKDAVIHQYVDESIIGGMVLRVQDQLIDASVKTQLAAMKRQLLEKAPR